MGWRCSDGGSQHPGGSRWTSRLCDEVGYILMTTDGPGLERKFAAKQRNRNKPGVVLCSSIEQLTELAELNDEILTFYQTQWDSDILLGSPPTTMLRQCSQAKPLTADMNRVSWFPWWTNRGS